MRFWAKKEKPAETAPGPLEERVRALESRVRQLDDDLSDLFERHARLQGRRAKREARENELPELTPEQEINERIKRANGANPFYRS